MLKKSLFSTVFVLAVFLFPSVAQNVAINVDGSAPNPNAMLDVQASNKGVLIPRISTSARLAIPNTKGLLVYDTTTSSFWYNTGSSWQTLSASASDSGAWGLHGNIVDTSKFIGSLNNAPFIIKVNGLISGLIHPVSSNVAWGYRSGNGLLQPVDTANTAIGTNTLPALQHGEDNTAVGANVLTLAFNCKDNTAMGQLALFYDTTGSYNTAIGQAALFQTTYGNYNTALGNTALSSNFSGSGNTGIGAGANVATPFLTNATAIGYNATVNASNKVRIGNSAVTVIEGQVPFTTPSDGRFKFDVQEDVKGLDFIRLLRPVTYHFDVESFDLAGTGQPASPILHAAYKEATAIRRSGFIAQEVEQAASTSGYDFSGIVRPKTDQDHYSLSYESFVVPLVKAVQEQQRQIELLQQEKKQMEKRLTELENKLNKATLGGATKL